MRWNVSDMVDAVWSGLREAAAGCDAEQAVYGIDCLDELALHPLIQGALREAGYGVWPEQAYPSARMGRKRKSEGKRCDIVLTPGESRGLVDPEAEATLFGEAGALPLEAAYWLEVKTVSQFTKEGPFAHYGKELLAPVTQDIRKLSQDALIFHAGLLLVLFTADAATARHDLALWESKALRKGFPIASPVVRELAITERMGNAHLSVALAAVRRL